MEINRFSLLRSLELKVSYDAVQFHPNAEIIMVAPYAYGDVISEFFLRYSEIKFMNIKTGWQVSKISIPQEKIVKFACSKDGKYIIIISENGKLQIWELQEPFAYKLMHSTLTQENPLEIQINANQSFFAVRYKDSIRLYQLPIAELVYEWQGHQGKILCMAFNAGGYVLASGGADHKVILWDLTKQQPKDVLTAHRSEIDALFFLDGSDQLFSADVSGVHYIWKTQFVDAAPMAMGHTAAVTDVEFDMHSQIITSYGKDHSVCSWHATSGQLIRTLRLPKKLSHQFERLVNHGKQYIQLSESVVEVWDTVAGTLQLRYPMQNPVVSMEVSKNGKLIALVTNDGVNLLDIDQNKFKVLCHSFVLAKQLYFCGQDKYLLTVFDEPGNQVKVWEIATQQCIKTLTVNTGNITAVAVNHRNTIVVLGDEWGHLYIYNFDTGMLLKNLQPRTYRVIALYFSPDDNYLYCETKHELLGNTVNLIDGVDFKTPDIGYTLNSGVNSAWSHDGGLFVTSGALMNENRQGLRPVTFSMDLRADDFNREFATSAVYVSKLYFTVENKLVMANDKGDVALWQYKMGAVRREWFLLWSSSTSLEVENSRVDNAQGLPTIDLNLFAGDKQQKAVWNDLHMACARGDEARVKALLQAKSISVNALGEDNDTPLHVAIENGHAAIAQLLLEQGADYNAKGRYGRTPLHVAAYYGRLNIVKQLLTLKKLDIGITDDNAEIVLHPAIQRGQQAIVETIFAFDADNKIRQAKDRSGNTPLLLAIEYHHEGILCYLIAQGADVSAKTKDGKNLLHWAAICAGIEILKIIFGLPIAQDMLKEKDLDGYTPLHYAANCDGIEKLEFLIAQGANLEVQSNLLLTPLHNAIYCGRDKSVTLLACNGANVKATLGSANETPLELAVRNNYFLIVKFLLSLKDYQAISADEAAKLFTHYVDNNRRCKTFFNLFLEKGFDKKLTDSQWHNLLENFIRRGMTEEIEMLLRSSQTDNFALPIEQQRRPTARDGFKLFRHERFLNFDPELNDKFKEECRAKILLLLLDAGFDIDEVHPSYKYSFYHHVVSSDEYPLLKKILNEHKAKIEEAEEQALLGQAIVLSLADKALPESVSLVPPSVTSGQLPEQSGIKTFLNARERTLARGRQDDYNSGKLPAADDILEKSIESKGLRKP